MNQLLGIDSARRAARRDRAALPAARPLRRADLADHGRALPRARRDHPPRRRRLGLRARRRPRRRRDPPVHAGDRDRARRAAASPASRRTAAASRPDVVVSAVAGWSTLVCDLAGVRLPITTHILQAFVTEPVKPFLDVIIVSAQMHVYVSQTDRGEFLIGAEIEPYTTYKSIGTLPVPRVLGAARARALPAARAAAACCARGPASATSRPTTARSSAATEVESFHVSAGWGTYGFKAAPIVGTTLAELVATGQDARPDRAVRARALPHRHARLRARGGGRLALGEQPERRRRVGRPFARCGRPACDIPGPGPRRRLSQPSKRLLARPPRPSPPGCAPARGGRLLRGEGLRRLGPDRLLGPRRRRIRRERLERPAADDRQRARRAARSPSRMLAPDVVERERAAVEQRKSATSAIEPGRSVPSSRSRPRTSAGRDVVARDDVAQRHPEVEELAHAGRQVVGRAR